MLIFRSLMILISKFLKPNNWVFYSVIGLTSMWSEYLMLIYGTLKCSMSGEKQGPFVNVQNLVQYNTLQ